MPNKTTRCVLFAGLFLFFASTVVAELIPVGDCTDLGTTCCQDDIGRDFWQFILIGGGPTLVTDPTSDTVKCKTDWEECFEYSYQVLSEDESTPSQVLLTIPFSFDEQVDVDGFDPFKVHPNGAGDETTEFAEYVQEIRVMEIPNNAKIYTFWSNVGRVSRASIGLKNGNYLGTCAIDGPNANGYDPTEVFTVSSERTIYTSDNKKFHLVEDINTECIDYGSYEQLLPGDPDYGVYTDNQRLLKRELLEDVLQSKLGEDEEGNPTPTPIEFVGDTNQRCKRSIVKSKGPHTWYFISGRYLWR